MRLKQHTSAAKPDSNPWLPGIEEVPAGRMKLFCFPWAGGGALPYRAWRDKLSALACVVPVRLPGRETRAAEPAFERMAPLVDALLKEIRPFLDAPFSFFGHSMGAGISFSSLAPCAVKGCRCPCPSTSPEPARRSTA
ncbi:MAG: thioesterase domain-containing protein [Paludibaculum sp.]